MARSESLAGRGRVKALRTFSVIFFGWISSAGFAADCLQPILDSVFPPELRVDREGGSRSVTLFGRGLGMNPIWQAKGESSRCVSQVWVRTGDQDAWEVALDGADLEGQVVLRQRGEGWGRLEFTGSDWLGDAKSLALMVVRGWTRMDGTFDESGRSEPIVVNLVESPTYDLTIDRVVPSVVRPGSPGAVIRLEGRFTWDTEVILNGEPVTASFTDPGTGIVEIELGADLLDDEDSHVISVQNSDGARSKETLILITEPTRIKKTSPSRLRSGRRGQTVKLQFEGAAPERVEIRYQPALGLKHRAESLLQEDFSEDLAKEKPPRSETVTVASILIDWEEVEARIRKSEISFRVDADQVPGPGALIVRLSGPTGKIAAVLMIEGSVSNRSTTPDYEPSLPEKDPRPRTQDKK